MKSLAWACRGPGGGIGALRRRQRCDARGEAASSVWWPERGSGRCADESCPRAGARARALKSVLVVDDDPDICTMLGFILSQAAGADDPLVKPFTRRELLQRVRVQMAE